MSMITVPPPSELANTLIGRDYLSFSAISTFQSCPLKFYFKYSLGLPEETISAGLVFGSAVHSALEHHFRELLEGSPAPKLAELLDVYHSEWRERDLGNVLFGDGDEPRDFDSLAERMLRAFQESDAACPGGEIIGIEESLRGELFPGCPDLLARVDLLVDTGTTLVLTDFKTSRGRWNRDHVQESAGQLLLYHELASDLAGGRPIKLEFTVVTKTKNPAVESHPVPVSEQQIERTKRIVERVWQAIRSGHFYPNPSPMQCPTCPYRGPCRAWKG
jgi:CRISPR/Cas system-associated exonuclease Cas4 (RecB family)